MKVVIFKINYTMRMNRNLKIFLANGIPFGIFTAILFSSLYGIKVGLSSGLISGLIFGFLMFIILGFLHSRAVEKIAGEKSEESMGTYQERNIKLQLPYDRTFDLCIKSLNLISRCRVQEEDRSQGKIIARSFINWKTWGDTISFDIAGISNENTAVKVSSRPTSWSTLVDYGKNLENVNTIVSFLEKGNTA
ncbi:MAG: hypothetical protein HZB30_09790 [Nitrospirae bacterium]|nr:hypothetical protein [Nitrospirota bacterium]